MNLFAELKRRNVVRVGIAYALIAWVVLQAADFGLQVIDAPNWILQVFVLTAFIGLPVVLIFSWIFEMTPEGIKRETEIDRSASVAPQTGRKLDRAIIIFLVLVIAIMGAERFWPGTAPGAGMETAEHRSDTFSEPDQAATAKSIAILPFADLSAAQDQAWFADGLAEEILNALSRTPDLLVSSRTASFRYRDSELPIEQIADELGVTFILEGSIRSADEKIRVTAQLIRAPDGFQLFSETYDRGREDLIGIQEDLALSIARALETGMDPDALENMTRVGTRSVEAYVNYLKARSLVNSTHSENRVDVRREQMKLFESATAADPGFAQAWFAQAFWWRQDISPQFIMSGASGLDPQAAGQRLNHAIDRAIEHAQSEADRKGYLLLKAEQQGRLRDAIALGEEYLAERPNDSFVRFLNLQNAMIVGDQAASSQELEALRQLGLKDLPAAMSYNSFGYRLLSPDAVADYGLERLEDSPGHPGLLYQVHRVLLWAERDEEAASLLRQLPAGYVFHFMASLRQACAEGRNSDAEQIYQRRLREGSTPLDRWQMLQTLGRNAEATEAISELITTGTLFQKIQPLSYPSFDPAPHPELMAVLEREGALRPPPVALPFACEPEAGPSIAVLPFVNMSADADNEYFSDGVSEEILNVLADIPELKVASRTSAFRYKNSDLAIEDIADELGVNHVLEGSVRKSGNQVRITAQLIHADDGFHLWSETYDRQLDNIFAIQDEIAGNIAEVLQVQLLGENKPYSTIADLSPQSYEKFLKARFLLRRRNEDAVEEAIGLTRQVLQERPDFPRGQAQLAEALAITEANYSGSDEGTPEELKAEVRRLAQSALALDPDLAAAHMINSQLAMYDRNPLGAIRMLQRAIELDPTEPRAYHWLGMVLSNSGYLDQARDALQKAVELEPDHANVHGYLGMVYLVQGELDLANQHMTDMVRLGNPMGNLQLMYVNVRQGDFERARLAAEGIQAGNYSQTNTKRFLAAAQDPGQVDAYLEYTAAHPVAYWPAMSELFILGRYKAALDVLAQIPGSPTLDYAWSDEYSEARNLPEFSALLEQGNFYAVFDELGPPPACRKVSSGYDCTQGEAK